jgi:hypothetical protein
VKGYLSNGHRIVVLQTDSRGGGAVWAWDLDDPCAPLRTVTTHVVRRGEWLWSIARAELVARLVNASPTAVRRYADLLYARNRAAIGPNASRLRVGTVLVLSTVES